MKALRIVNSLLEDGPEDVDVRRYVGDLPARWSYQVVKKRRGYGPLNAEIYHGNEMVDWHDVDNEFEGEKLGNHWVDWLTRVDVVLPYRPNKESYMDWYEQAYHAYWKRLREAEEPEDVDVRRYLRGLKPNIENPDELLKLDYFVSPWGELDPHPPQQILVIDREDGYYLDVWRDDGQKRTHYGPFGLSELKAMKQRWPETRWLNYPLREADEDELSPEEVKHYLKQVKPKIRRYSSAFLRYVMGTPEGRKKLLSLRDEPEPPGEPHQIVGEADEFPEDDPTDYRAEVNRLLPTKTYHLKGNSMIHAPGVIRMAQNEWRVGNRKQKKWAMTLLQSWPGLPEHVYTAILNGEIEIETNGDDAVITVRL